MITYLIKNPDGSTAATGDFNAGDPVPIGAGQSIQFTDENGNPVIVDLVVPQADGTTIVTFASGETGTIEGFLADVGNRIIDPFGGGDDLFAGQFTTGLATGGGIQIGYADPNGGIKVDVITFDDIQLIQEGGGSAPADLVAAGGGTLLGRINALLTEAGLETEDNLGDALESFVNQPDDRFVEKIEEVVDPTEEKEVIDPLAFGEDDGGRDITGALEPGGKIAEIIEKGSGGLVTADSATKGLSQIFSYDVDSGESDPVTPDLAAVGITGMAADPDSNTIFVATRTGLFQVDAEIGEVTNLGPLPKTLGGFNLAYDPESGVLFGAASSKKGSFSLYELNSETAAKPLFFEGVDVSGLAFGGGQLFGVGYSYFVGKGEVTSRYKLFAIDPETQSIEVLMDLPEDSWSGLTFDVASESLFAVTGDGVLYELDYKADEVSQVVVTDEFQASSAALASLPGEGGATAGLSFDPETGKVTFTPKGNYDFLAEGVEGVVEFQYRLSGGEEKTGAVTVTGVNDAPEAQDDQFTVISGLPGRGFPMDGPIMNEDVRVVQVKDPIGFPILQGTGGSAVGNLFANNGSGTDSDVDSGDVFRVTTAGEGDPVSENGEVSFSVQSEGGRSVYVSVSSNGDIYASLTGQEGILMNAPLDEGIQAFPPVGEDFLIPRYPIGFFAPGEKDSATFEYEITDSEGATSIATVTLELRGPVSEDDGSIDLTAMLLANTPLEGGEGVITSISGEVRPALFSSQTSETSNKLENILEIDPFTGETTTRLGDGDAGPKPPPPLTNVAGMAVDAENNDLYVVEKDAYSIRLYDADSLTFKSTLSSPGSLDSLAFGGGKLFGTTNSGLGTATTSSLYEIDPSGGKGKPPFRGSVDAQITGLAFNSDTNVLYAIGFDNVGEVALYSYGLNDDKPAFELQPLNSFIDNFPAKGEIGLTYSPESGTLYAVASESPGLLYAIREGDRGFELSRPLKNDLDTETTGGGLAAATSEASLPPGVEFDAETGKVTFNPAGHYDLIPEGDSEHINFVYTVDGSEYKISIPVYGLNDAPEAQDDVINLIASPDGSLSRDPADGYIPGESRPPVMDSFSSEVPGSPSMVGTPIANLFADNGNGEDTDVDQYDSLTVIEAGGATLDGVFTFESTTEGGRLVLVTVGQNGDVSTEFVEPPLLGDGATGPVPVMALPLALGETDSLTFDYTISDRGGLFGMKNGLLAGGPGQGEPHTSTASVTIQLTGVATEDDTTVNITSQLLSDAGAVDSQIESLAPALDPRIYGSRQASQSLYSELVEIDPDPESGGTAVLGKDSGSVFSALASDEVKGVIYAYDSLGSLKTISVESGDVLSTITVGQRFNGLAYDSDTETLYGVSSVYNKEGYFSVLSKIDLETGVAVEVATANELEGLAYNSGDHSLYGVSPGGAIVKFVPDPQNDGGLIAELHLELAMDNLPPTGKPVFYGLAYSAELGGLLVTFGASDADVYLVDLETGDLTPIEAGDGSNFDISGVGLTALSIEGGLDGVVFDEGTRQVTFEAEGNYDYLNEGEQEEISFRYTVTGSEEVFTKSLFITGVNDAPVAQDDLFQLELGDSAAQQAASEQPSASMSLFADNGSGVDFDLDRGDSFTLVGFKALGEEAFTEFGVEQNTLSLTSDAGYKVTVSFKDDGTFSEEVTPPSQVGDNSPQEVSFIYQIEDSFGARSEATATLVLSGAGDNVERSYYDTVFFSEVFSGFGDIDIELAGRAGSLSGWTLTGGVGIINPNPRAGGGLVELGDLSIFYEKEGFGVISLKVVLPDLIPGESSDPIQLVNPEGTVIDTVLISEIQSGFQKTGVVTPTTDFSQLEIVSEPGDIFGGLGGLSFVGFEVYDSPVAIDLDGDGLEFVANAETAAAYDFNDDGVAEQTPWLSPDDAWIGIDLDGNGVINGRDELVFADHSETVGDTDLEAIAEVYDTNGDGLLTAEDDSFDDFLVWQDGNADGISTLDEVAGLTDFGIEAIGLVSDGEAYEAAGGEVLVAGEALFYTLDGETGTVGDVGLKVDFSISEELSEIIESEILDLGGPGETEVAAYAAVVEEAAAPVAAPDVPEAALAVDIAV